MEMDSSDKMSRSKNRPVTRRSAKGQQQRQDRKENATNLQMEFDITITHEGAHEGVGVGIEGGATAFSAPAPSAAAATPTHTVAIPDILLDFITEMRENFKMLHEKVDTLERKYNTLTEERNVTKTAGNKDSQPVSVNSSQNNKGKCAKSSDGKEKKDGCRSTSDSGSNEELTPQYLRETCRSIEQVLGDLILATQRGGVTKGNLLSAVAQTLDSENESLGQDG